LENVAHYPDIYAEWSANEKVALDLAIGAAYAGKRALAAMKHVGLNVASESLFYSSYTGVNAGLVIVTADDPGLHSSQNEQDNRHYARFAKVPCEFDSRKPRDGRRGADLSEHPYAGLTHHDPHFARQVDRGVGDRHGRTGLSKNPQNCHDSGFRRAVTRWSKNGW
jgi:hypothetical protein